MLFCCQLCVLRLIHVGVANIGHFVLIILQSCVNNKIFSKTPKFITLYINIIIYCIRVDIIKIINNYLIISEILLISGLEYSFYGKMIKKCRIYLEDKNINPIFAA